MLTIPFSNRSEGRLSAGPTWPQFTLGCLILALWFFSATPTWPQAPILAPSGLVDGGAHGAPTFGATVRAAGDILAVTQPADRIHGVAADSVFLFTEDLDTSSWSESLRLTFKPGESLVALATDGQHFAYALRPNSPSQLPRVVVWGRGPADEWTVVTELPTRHLPDALAFEGDELFARFQLGTSGDRAIGSSSSVAGNWQNFVTGDPFVSSSPGFDVTDRLVVSGSAFSRRGASDVPFPAPSFFPVPFGATLTPEGFGAAAAFSADGRWLAVGSPVDSQEGQSAGSVYLFDVTSDGNPIFVSRIAPSMAGVEVRFGTAVAFHDDLLAISAPAEQAFDVDPYTSIFRLTDDGRAEALAHLDGGGPSLALVDRRAFVGQPGAGRVLVYDIGTREPSVQINLDPVAVCQTEPVIPISGAISGQAPIVEIEGRAGENSEVLCQNCGTEPHFAFFAVLDPELHACQDTVVTVTATAADALMTAAETTVFLDEGELELDCPDQQLYARWGTFSKEAEPPILTDPCGTAAVACQTDNPDLLWPDIAAGLQTQVTCTATNRCQRTATCDFQVFLTEEDLIFQFTELEDSDSVGLEGMTESVEGAGTLLTRIAAQKLQVSHNRDSTEGDTPGKIAISQQIAGDVRLETQIPEVEVAGNFSAEGGLELKAGESPDSPKIEIARSSGGKLILRRSQIADDGTRDVRVDSTIDAEGVTDIAVEMVFPVLKVEYSQDGGQSWVGRPDLDLSLSAPPLQVVAGLFVASDAEVEEADLLQVPGRSALKSSTLSATFSFADLRFSRPEVEPEPTCESDSFEGETLDSAWTLAGVGNANQQSTALENGELQLTADGATAFFGADNMGFLYREVSGDFRMETTVDGGPMDTGGRYRKAGLTVRESLDKWDVRLLAKLVPFWNNTDETHLQFVARESHGTPGRLPVARDVVGVPRLLRLAVIRSGNTLSVEYSTDGGTTWIRPTTGLGGSITIDDLAETLLVGPSMVSNNISVTSTAHFDDFSLCQP
ncbi:MAG: hypothetical protein AAGM22_08190 [Acidobacteriota bacterium]